MSVAQANLSAAKQALRKKSLTAYTEWMYPGYKTGMVHRRIARMLEHAMVTPGFRGMLIVPPRFGKSELASIQFPGFYFGHFPEKEIIAASHTQDLSNHFSRRSRRNVQSSEYPFDTRVAHDAAAVEMWEVEGPDARKRGRYQAFGVGGAPAGRGADFLIVDDPVKNAKAAASEVQREATWEWWQTDALSRLQPGGSALVIGTRWHHDDLMGRIIEQNKTTNRWTILHYPAMLPDGTSLDPDRWPQSELELKRQDVGERTWEALYQGNPTADEGAVLKREWFPEYETLPDGVLYTIQSWDTAFKDNDDNDYSVCHTYAATVYGLFLVDRFKGRPEFPDLEREAIKRYETFHPKIVLIEDKASGISLGQVLRRYKGPRGAMPISMVPVPPGEGKLWRVHEATPILEGKRVFVPKWAYWKDEVLKEWTSFPLAAHDDEVDAMIQAVLREFGDPALPELQSTSYIEDAIDENDPDNYPQPRW